MEKFNAKDYIIEDLKAVTSANLNSGGNFSVSLLPDGNKGFIINRAKKQMTVDYEHARILDEKQQEMNREQVYQFISALRCDTINMPAGSGFADIPKGKTYAEQLYYFTTNLSPNNKLLRNLVRNGLAFINLIKRGPYDTERMDFTFEDIQALQSIWLHYMSQEELASEITDYIFNFYTIPNSKMPIFIDISEILAELVGRDIIASIIGAIMTKLLVKFDSADFHPDKWQKIAKADSILTQFQACPDSFFAMYVAYGHSGARNILKAIMSDCTIDTIPDDLYKLAPENQNRYRLRWERIVEYMVNERKKQGYTHDFTTFLNEWTDTLKASYSIHETIDEKGIAHNRVPKDEKYPSCLASLHRKNSNILRNYSQKNNTSLYTARRITLKIYEYTTKDKLYTFRLPLSDADMIKEAQQQDNCLAGYTTAHATGETTIVFMRYTASPDKSLVTIERRGDRVIQKYRACNRHVSEQEEKAVQEWLRETCEAKLIEQRVKEEVQKRLKNVQEDQHKSTGSHTA